MAIAFGRVHQLAMRAGGDDSPAIDEANLVCTLNSGDAMRDNESGLSSAKLFEAVLNI